VWRGTPEHAASQRAGGGSIIFRTFGRQGPPWCVRDRLTLAFGNMVSLLAWGLPSATNSMPEVLLRSPAATE
jgi:hypothetical protein